MAKHLTGEQIRAVVEEISALHQRENPEAWAAGKWRIHEIEHFYMLPTETYAVTYEHGQKSIFERAAWGDLLLVMGWSYYASDNFEDMHDRQPESEVGHA